MSQFTFLEIDTDAEVEKIVRQFDKLKDKLGAPDVLQKVVKTTAQKVKKQLVKDAKERYALVDESGLKDTSKGAPRVTTERGASVSAAIRSKGPMQDIMAFLTQPNTKTGAAAAKVLNRGTEKRLEINGLKAFVTRFASGHVAIVQRDPHGEYSSGRAVRAQKYGKSADMTKLKKLLSPAVPHMLGNEEVREKAEKLAYQIMQQEMDKLIQKITAAT